MPVTAEATHVNATHRAVAGQSCPVCGKPANVLFLSADEVSAQLRMRDRFFAARLDRTVSPDGLRDLTDVLLGTPAAILRCMRCGVLVRDEARGDDVFRDDPYDDDVLASLHETHVRAFREKESDYRSLLPPNADVAEIGSYVGGFLRAAAEWSWRAIGFDICRDPVRFCRARGLDARCVRFEASELDDRACDGVFVWNCFEQLARPVDLLIEARRVLRASGLLVIRVPDADFYIQCEQEHAWNALAYNALLGWPHRFGYDVGTLRRLVQKHGFTFVRVLQRPAIRPFRDAMQTWAREEEARIIDAAHLGWIEATFVKR